MTTFHKYFFAGIVLLLGLGVFYLRPVPSQQATAQLRPNTVEALERHWAENWIQFSYLPGMGGYDSELDVSPFDIFVNTQIALMKSPMVLKSVVENPAISRLANIQKQADPIQWITSKLMIEGALSNAKKGEIYTVSFESIDPKEAEMIVNAVVDSYMSYYQIQQMQQEQTLQKSLSESKANHETLLYQLKQQLPNDFNPQAPLDVNSARILAQIDLELRAIDQISERLIRLEISRGTASRVRVLQRASSQHLVQVP
ncbi:MAG: hypothetical protein FWC43_07710 [Planctomycetaceae bacterium]|nr:hypothetical protein [Planctomycetaceae bacterium]